MKKLTKPSLKLSYLKPLEKELSNTNKVTPIKKAINIFLVSLFITNYFSQESTSILARSAPQFG
ncbi:hypothetical protein GCM10023311_23010 [Flaviramulus aquimarinus]|uniref:Uncharacterized protein n=1 Tax=Flaviramulus aquimarinus TaxID=1170456 RepID=A0ABP9FB90_9FLAO